MTVLNLRTNLCWNSNTPVRLFCQEGSGANEMLLYANALAQGVSVFQGKRMQREAATVKLMIRRYCRDKHSSTGVLCAECSELLDYARRRLAHCPFQEGKTTCGKCLVHCYKPGMRSRIRDVMRYVGPRLMVTNPLLSIRHALDGLRKQPSGHDKAKRK